MPKGYCLSEFIKNEAIRMYKIGFDQHAIAVFLKISTASVNQLIKKENFPKKIKECRYCHKEFVAEKDNIIYCSQKCRQNFGSREWRKSRPVKVFCDNCGALCHRKSKNNKHKNFFCSRKCFYIFKEKELKLRNLEIQKMYLEGRLLKDICDKFQLSRRRIEEIVKKLRTKARAKGRYNNNLWTKEQDDILIEHIHNSKKWDSLIDLDKTLNRSIGAVRTRLVFLRKQLAGD